MMYNLQLNSEHLTCLTEKEIPFMRGRGDSYIIEEEQLSEVLECIGITSEDQYKISGSSEVEGLCNILILPRLESSAPVMDNVNIVTWTGNGSQTYISEFLTIVSKFSDTIDKNVSVYTSTSRGNVTPEKYNIYMDTSVTGVRHEQGCPRHIFGIKLNSAYDRRSYSASGEGVCIWDNGYVVAEVFKDSLYINFDITKYGDAQELNIFKEILDKTFTILQDYDAVKNKKYLFSDSDEPISREILEIFKELNLAKLINRSILLNTERSEIKLNVVNENMFYFNIGHVTGNRINDNINPDKFLGYKCSNTFLIPSSNSIGFWDEETNIVYAEYVQDKGFNILLGDLKVKQKGLIKKILSTFQTFLTSTSEEKQAHINNYQTIIDQNNLADMLNTLNAKKNELLLQERKNINTLTTTIAQCQKKILSMSRNLSHSMKIVDVMANDEGWSANKLTREFSSVKKNKNVKRYYFDSTSIHVFTENIYCKHPKTKDIYDIGEFEIILNISEREQLVLFKNLTRQVDAYDSGMQAPHVFPRGNPCLGSIGSTLPELVSNCEYAVAIDLCIQFLQTVNLADVAGRHIEAWPLVKNETTTV